MAKTIKFNDGKVRLWEGIGKKTKCPNIAIKFHKSITEKEIGPIRKTIKDILTLKYGEGVKSRPQ